MKESPLPPLAASVLGAIQDRQSSEAAKLAYLLAVGQKLDQVLEELRTLNAAIVELLDRTKPR
jgi:hypothetical protein